MKLIDILNKIANGELKEGTKIKYNTFTYVYNDKHWLERCNGVDLLDDIWVSNLNDVVELIEPKHLPDVGEMAECFSNKGNTLEPTDNTKIEELDINEISFQRTDKYGRAYPEIDTNKAIAAIWNKLNEVIRKINK
jgi:hypothetical protein